MLTPMAVWRYLCALAVLLAGSAAAQSISAKPDRFGYAECVDPNFRINVEWDLGSSYIAGTPIEVSVTKNSDCSVTTGAPANVQPAPTQKGSQAYAPVDLLVGETALCDADINAAKAGATYVCVKVTGFTSLDQKTSVSFALQPPAPPAVTRVVGGDQHLRINWDKGDSSDKVADYDLYAGAHDPNDSADGGTPGEDRFDGVDPVQRRIADTFARLENLDGKALENDQTYDVAVLARDEFGNESELSEVATGTPRAVDDFYAHYRQAGGAALGGGGCASAGAGWLAGLALAALLVGWRRRKGAALALLLGASLPAAAVDERPPRRLLFAIKVDRYDPQVDSEFKGAATPYRDIFGGRAPGRWQLEVDWQPIHWYGSLLVGGTVGYWQNIGRGRLHDTGAQSEDTALLDVIPLSVVATYRFDWAADRLRIPIIPYAQVGLSAALWAAFNGRGDVVSTPAIEGRTKGRGSGWTTGFTSAIGVALALDTLDSGLAREAYMDARIQRTSLFAEYGWTHLDGFGSKSQLVLSDRAWRFGLALEF